MIEQNPVVMLCGRIWHIVELGRASRVGICGRELRDCRAHSRMNTVGPKNICPECLKTMAQFPDTNKGNDAPD